MPTTWLMWLTACAAATTAGSSRTEPTDALIFDLGFPQILSTMPKQENVLDLGPVLVPEGSGEPNRLAVLLEAADQLGADAFVFERRELRYAYPIQRSRVRTWREGYAGEIYDAARDLYTGRSSPAPRVVEVGYYRALRFFDHPPNLCSLDRPLLGDSVVSMMSRADSFREQLRLLNVLFADGVLSGNTFRKQRAKCLEQLDAGEDQVVLQ